MYITCRRISLAWCTCAVPKKSGHVQMARSCVTPCVPRAHTPCVLHVQAARAPGPPCTHASRMHACMHHACARTHARTHACMHACMFGPRFLLFSGLVIHSCTWPRGREDTHGTHARLQPGCACRLRVRPARPARTHDACVRANRRERQW